MEICNLQKKINPPNRYKFVYVFIITILIFKYFSTTVWKNG